MIPLAASPIVELGKLPSAADLDSIEALGGFYLALPADKVITPISGLFHVSGGYIHLWLQLSYFGDYYRLRRGKVAVHVGRAFCAVRLMAACGSMLRRLGFQTGEAVR